MKVAFLVLISLATAFHAFAALADAPHNVILFVADGLRYGSVDPRQTPNLARVKREGVDFTNSHALYPTLTTVNAAAIATGHYVGDTGDFGNTIYVGFPVAASYGTTVPGLENDTVLAEMNAHFGGNYINEVSLLDAAHAQGLQTAVIGKRGPTRIQALAASALGTDTIIVDDTTGHAGGITLAPGLGALMHQNFVGREAPPVSVPNYTQQMYLVKMATRVVLPKFKETGKPFVMVFWSRDPDTSQHGAQDSVGELTPGIDGPTAEAGVRDADTSLGLLLEALEELALDRTTDVFVTADHGFTTIVKSSLTSPAAHATINPMTPITDLPSGFLAIDVASFLHRPLYDPARSFAQVDYNNGRRLSHGVGYIGLDPAYPQAIVAPNGGSGLIYLPDKDAKATAGVLIENLLRQDYVSGLFVNDELGRFPGTLPMSAISLIGSALTPRPSIYVNFRSFSTGCAAPLMCTVEVADTSLKTGQGMHGSFSRAETRNFMAAIGPDFKAGFRDPAPVSNADIAPTLAHLVGVVLPAKGSLQGRVITEALKGGKAVKVEKHVLRSDSGENGLETVLHYQQVGATRYFDAAGFPGRTVGVGSE